MKLKCHHCGSRAVIRTSRTLSALVREAYCQCTNVECATTYKIHVATVHTIAPSLNPNPRVYVPVGKVDRLPTDSRQLPLIDA
ncbi:ogr/Delta-like zinc finger family protein [Burkholderia ubonensis]|uniref:ogr/Delta-like zinc finger family protein n=1 Tax=Burkholderia TaxID=32008 RepID=UPI002AB5B331|nr:ogr/Delta-like zinc finger family protein [Burkholderia ubonensis]MDY7792183.1 ogr/Delta-like zinc finger family protein [Burkholderia ubonensis]